MATERAGASESNVTPARNVKVVTNFKINPASAKLPRMIAPQSLDASPAGCGKLATFHVVARDEVPGNLAKSSHPGGALDIRPAPSYLLAALAWLAQIGWSKPPHLDSGHPKSTVDLGLPALIWGDDTLFRLLNTESACPKPTETLGIFSVSRNQTEIQPNQAGKLFSTVDLGCLQSFSASTGFYIRAHPTSS
jgi:hypothetical protein